MLKNNYVRIVIILVLVLLLYYLVVMLGRSVAESDDGPGSLPGVESNLDPRGP